MQNGVMFSIILSMIKLKNTELNKSASHILLLHLIAFVGHFVVVLVPISPIILTKSIGSSFFNSFVTSYVYVDQMQFLNRQDM